MEYKFVKKSFTKKDSSTRPFSKLLGLPSYMNTNISFLTRNQCLNPLLMGGFGFGFRGVVEEDHPYNFSDNSNN